MSKSAYRSPPPSPPPSYDPAEDEQTAVRARRVRAPSASASGEHVVVREPEDSDRPTLPSPTGDLALRGERMERKLRFARVLLKLLPANDSRAKVLRAAML